MYIHEMTFSIEWIENLDDCIWEVYVLLGCYRNNWQILWDEWENYVNNNILHFIFSTPELGSLEDRYNNSYANAQIKKINNLYQINISFNTLGEVPVYPGVCECKKSNYYILITNYLSIDSPMVCGDCWLHVPLYRFPKTWDTDDDYYDIIHWKTQYTACDQLNMSCWVLEKSATKQLQDIHSTLSIQWRKICSDLEKQTKIPFYYYLYNYRNKNNDKNYNHCPVCLHDWNLEDKIHDLFDRKCDKCKLISHRTLQS